MDNLTKKVYDFYSKYSYPNIIFLKKRTHVKLMKRLLATAGIRLEDLEGMNVLDAGCGTGDKSVFMALYGANVRAIDINDFQIERAKKLAKKYGVNVDFQRKNLLEDFEENEKYDLVISTGVLHHTSNPKKAFINIARLVKPGGRIIIGLYNKYARIHYRIIRKILHVYFKGDQEKIMRFVYNSPLNSASKQTLYDRYAIPHESYHTLGEVVRWYDEMNFKPIDIYPKGDINNKVITQLNWASRGKSFFVVGGVRT